MTTGFKKPSLVVPRGELKSVLEHALSRHFGGTLHIRTMTRCVSDYCSSYLIEELDVTLTDGRALSLIFKDLSPGAVISTARNVKPQFLYEPRREIECYRALLAPHELGTAKCYGAVVDPEIERYWLFLERVPPSLLWQMGDIEVWKQVARWLAGIHAYLADDLAARRPSQVIHLLKYGVEYYWRWMHRAQRFIRHGDKSVEKKSTAAVNWLAERYDNVVQRLYKLPVMLIHGEFYPANIMIDPAPKTLRICPVDWEMAAIGPGLMDLAALSCGNWTPEQKNAMAFAYLDALPKKPAEWRSRQHFLEDLDYCRLHQAIVLLGWSEKWSPPPEHDWDWLAEAVRLAEKLRL